MWLPRRSRRVLAAAVGTATLLFPIAGHAQQLPANPVPPPTVTRVGDQQWGIAVKRPVLQAACRYCPWGALADIVQKMMSFDGFDVGICYTCSMQNAVRTVAKRLPPVPLGERTTALGVKSPGPPAPMDFGITSLSGVLNAYRGQIADLPEGRSLRLIARIEQPEYLMVAVTRDRSETGARAEDARSHSGRQRGDSGVLRPHG